MTSMIPEHIDIIVNRSTTCTNRANPSPSPLLPSSALAASPIKSHVVGLSSSFSYPAINLSTPPINGFLTGDAGRLGGRHCSLRKQEESRSSLQLVPEVSLNKLAATAVSSPSANPTQKPSTNNPAERRRDVITHSPDNQSKQRRPMDSTECCRT